MVFYASWIMEKWKLTSTQVGRLITPEQTCLLPLSRPACYPWADLPTTPRLTCLLPLNWPAYYPWADLPTIPELTFLLPLSWPACYPWADLPTTPELTCLIPLSWPAYYPWADLPATPELTCLQPLSWPAYYPWGNLPATPELTCLLPLPIPGRRWAWRGRCYQRRWFHCWDLTTSGGRLTRSLCKMIRLPTNINCFSSYLVGWIRMGTIWYFVQIISFGISNMEKIYVFC